MSNILGFFRSKTGGNDSTAQNEPAAEQSSSMHEILLPEPADDNEGWETVESRRSRRADNPPTQPTLENSNLFAALGHDSEDDDDDEPAL